MSNRVLLDASGLKVSKPGVDVLLAGPGDLLMSSDWSQLGIFAVSTIAISWTTSGFTGYWTGSVSFGKTFASPPPVFFEWDYGSGRYMPIGGAGGFSRRLAALPRQFWVIAQVSASGIQFYARYDRVDGTWVVPQATFRYTVMTYNL